MDTLYDNIGSGYNLTRQADPFVTERLIHHLKPELNQVYLDIGCGTGNYTIAIAQNGFSFWGIDPSEQMLDIARSRNKKIKWLNGFAEQLPAEDNFFDGIIGTLTIHHWKDLKKAFSEIARTLSENGRIVLFTSTPEQMEGYWLNQYFPKMLKSSILQMPSLHSIEEAIKTTDLKITNTEIYFIEDKLKDHFLYSGKNNPDIYFEETFRNGISSFTSLANSEEVECGLKKLRNDIDNNLFDEIKNRYKSESGDYLFITIRR